MANAITRRIDGPSPAQGVDFIPRRRIRARTLSRPLGAWVTQSAFDDEPDRDLVPIVAAIREQILGWDRKPGGNPYAAMFGADL